MKAENKSHHCGGEHCSASDCSDRRFEDLGDYIVVLMLLTACIFGMVVFVGIR